MPASTMSFIDAMSCGLGAAILIFFIIDFKSGSASGGDIETEISVLKTEIKEYSQRNADLGEQVSNTKTQVSKLANATADATMANINLEIDNSDTASQNAAITAKLEEELKKRGEVKDAPNPGLQGQLLGIKVQGKHIAILFDSSASMSAERIIDVVVAQDTGPAALAQGKKWGQSRRLANWVVDQVPATSKFDLIAFSEQASSLTNGYIAMSDKAAVGKLKVDVMNSTPIGGTNLSSAINYVKSMNPQPTHAYLITDGLPTKKNGGRSGVSGCKNGSPYVSGRCRAGLVSSAQQSWLRSIELNIFLLHLEGDSKSAPLYYRWARATNGVLFSPTRHWP